jgi:hypothetical protein
METAVKSTEVSAGGRIRHDGCGQELYCAGERNNPAEVIINDDPDLTLEDLPRASGTWREAA